MREIIRKKTFNSTLAGGLLLLLGGVLGGCGSSYPRALNYPFDRGGNGFNTPASELTPDVARRYVVFASDRNGSQDIYLYDASERRFLPLPGLNALDAIASHPSVSADGRYIVYAANLRGRSGIFLYDREVQISRNLTADLPAEVRNPTISADGSRIAYEASPNGHWDIYVCDRSGKRLNLP